LTARSVAIMFVPTAYFPVRVPLGLRAKAVEYKNIAAVYKF